ncbi:MAG TPA: type VI secretion system baseplate subunit TssG [Gemmataceae bacterium]|nr:type VI secretion system baseplate subunit TssG [Gemmataceae bacterium]
MNIADRLYADGAAFDFFQAVRVLARRDPTRRPVGLAASPREEVVRFRTPASLTFPASSIDEIRPPSGDLPMPIMTVTFFGLTGPSGALPRHYTEYVMRQERDGKGEEKHAFRAWLDLFNHRLISLFYRAWEKYRFYLAYERGAYARPEPDPFTAALFSLIGLGSPSLRGRLRVACREQEEEGPPTILTTVRGEGLSHLASTLGSGGRGSGPERVLARIDDLALLYYAGLLAQRPHSAVGLQAILEDFFGLPVRVQQFLGRWMLFDAAGQSKLGEANCGLGQDVTAGERVYDVQSKVRLRIGPLPRARFDAFLPDRSPVPERKAIFLMIHLTRLYLGPELDFDIQVVLRAADVPPCRMKTGAGFGPRLGWNTWICTHTVEQDADDAVFEGEEVYCGSGP